MPVIKDLKGQKFGYLTVIERDGSIYNKPAWKCLCKCGNEKTIMGQSLRACRTKSCGCFDTEVKRKRWTTHGKRKTPTYNSWDAMIQRCTNKNFKQYRDYGGRGITVCNRWLKFENFLEDMGERPEEMTLDRYPDQNGNYEPSNCRWATRLEQQNNTRVNVNIETSQGRMSISEASRRYGIPKSTIRYRIKRGLQGDALFTTC